jgi:hypothetical protein
LLDAALGATREYWMTHTCPDCGKKERIPASVPDVRSRVTAIKLLREGLGRVEEGDGVALDFDAYDQGGVTVRPHAEAPDVVELGQARVVVVSRRSRRRG